MPAVFQTPGTWVLAGGGAFWSAECRAALASCGIDPDAFGTYQQRLDAQAKLREGYRKQRVAEAESGLTPGRPHEGNCSRATPANRDSSHACSCHESLAGYNDFLNGTNGAPANPTGAIQPWLTAGAQSGHNSGNAFYQDSGGRGDPCANTRPSGYDANTQRYANTGSYGYDDDQAFCMDHYGRANDPGTAHHQITRREAAQSREARAAGGGPITQADMEDGVRGTAEIATRGSNSRVNGTAPAAFPDAVTPLTAAQRQRSDALTAAQQQSATQLLQREAASGNVAAQQALAGATPNSPSGPGPTSAQQKLAVECITAAWKQSLDEMRAQAINNHSTVGTSSEAAAAVAAHNAGPPVPARPARGYTDLPPARRAAVDAAVGDRVRQRQHDLEKAGAQRAGASGANGASPTANECREYQANWLISQRGPNGGYPPMQGSPQKCNGPGPLPAGQTAPPPPPASAAVVTSV